MPNASRTVAGRLAVVLAAVSIVAHFAMAQTRPTPTQRQLEWHAKPYYAFCHFGPNTFLDQEWGSGKEDPNVFNPTEFDPRQWCKVFKEAGMSGVIITAKHHDGFCLWPSKFSTHTVKQSKWRDGKGDVLKELSAACKEFGLRFGVYLSPWDRNHPDYGTPKYNETFAATLKEVLTTYGPVSEVWFDGANGEGPNGKRQIYDWSLFISTVRRHAPKAVIFSDAGPDVRWVGNEQGYASETNWATVNSKRYVVGTPLYNELGEGQESGDVWRPAECDVSIRPGWFYHPSQNNQVKTAEKLIDIYLGSIGRGANLLLNVPPDRRGLIHENDVRALMQLAEWRQKTFKPRANLKPVRKASAKGILRVQLPPTARFDLIDLKENIRDGQRVREFRVLAESGGKSVVLASGTTIGPRRIVRVPMTTTTQLTLEMEANSPMPENHVDLAVHATQDGAFAETAAERDKRMKWWREARFGMFIHWGLYAIPAGEWKGKNYTGASEWLIYHAGIPTEQWMPFIREFNPIRFEAKRWVQIAKDAGMKYLVITSKHHEGFALWDSKASDFDVMASPFKRDILKELAAACKEAGIRFCVYHSILDWHHPDYLPRSSWDKRPESQGNMDRYVAFMKSQLKELVKGYDPGVLWFDGEWENRWTAEYGRDVYKMLRELDKDLIINNRVGRGRAGMSGFDSGSGAVGDFGTPEQEIPSAGIPGVDWESCMTMNESWGYHKNDHNWKSPAKLVQNLIDCASKGGNYLLNVGPTALGEIPPESIERLAKVGAWTNTYGESIYGTQAGPFTKALPWGRVTRRGNALYCHVFDESAKEIELTGFSGKILKISVLGSEGAASLMMGYSSRGPVIPVPQTQRDASLAGLPRVLVVETDGNFEVKIPPIGQNADGSVLLKAIDATTSGGSARYEDQADKQCIGFWTTPESVVSWTFEIDKPGEFQLVAEIACDPQSDGSEYEIKVAGQSIKGAVKATKSWADFVKVDLGKIALVRAGSHTVTIQAIKIPKGAAMNLRSLTFKPK